MIEILMTIAHILPNIYIKIIFFCTYTKALFESLYGFVVG